MIVLFSTNIHSFNKEGIEPLTENNIITVPLLPLRGFLIYPTLSLQLDIGRDKSVQAIEEALRTEDKQVFAVAQENTNSADPVEEDLYRIGTLVKIERIKRLSNGTVRVLLEGTNRAELLHCYDKGTHVEVEVQIIPEEETSEAVEAAMRTLLEHFEKYASESAKNSDESMLLLASIEEPDRLIHTIVSNLPLKLAQKQEILSIVSVQEQLETLISLIQDEKQIMELQKEISNRVKRSMERTQKEFYLREQLKAIQKELDTDGKGGELDILRKKIIDVNMPESTEKVALKELDRYEKLPAVAPEGSVIRNYIDWLVSLPWEKTTEDTLDVIHAEKVLDEDHYGLEKVKERILEYLAVQQLTNSLKGPILCLVGPPGVGKTSLARSIAKSLDRHFVRMSLGGVRDETEIRGHRRTYIGAMPGRIIQSMKKAETINPVFLLDEIDKMSNDFRGDPSSAMLEVLDPEQNNTFSDHYIEEPYNLSKVLFIATANDLSSIPRPLLDRMEVISLSGYTELEKLHIAKDHLLPKQMKEHGLKKSNLIIKDEVIMMTIQHYTREAGVRTLERMLATFCRKVAKAIVMENRRRVTISNRNIEEYLGKPKYQHHLKDLEDQIGVATGLAYTSVGGDTLAIEVSLSNGKGKLQLTGKLGDVMKESAQTAFSYVRSRAEDLGIDPDFYEQYDIHIHVPEGAVPKDGPSAGITIATALISALTEKPVDSDIGMTGEITLRGRVLPIGGVKEKALGAHRSGLKKIILPLENKRDIDDIPKSIRQDLEIVFVSHIDEVLKHALV